MLHCNSDLVLWSWIQTKWLNLRHFVTNCLDDRWLKQNLEILLCNTFKWENMHCSSIYIRVDKGIHALKITW